ncbi:MAG: helix-turn-helix domain-containing protein, partial [Patescibacteria group bacterium]|nr:helix-turn-helix domain-containing protein [Patescibacteria group bacterium]
MLSILEKLGLSEKEAKVYLATLELAQDTVQNIAKKAGVNRPTTYFILKKLMQLGLISTLEKGKKTLFIAENPKELENLLDERVRDIERGRKELKDNMNQLLAIYNIKQGKPIVKYFEGLDGLEAMDRY